MAYVQHLGGNKYKVTISAGFKPNGDRNRIFKTIDAKSPAQAQKKANLLEAEVEKGDYIEPTHFTFAQYCEVWAKDAQRKLAPKTYYRYNEMLKIRINPHIGGTKLEKINPILLENFYNELREPQQREQTLKNGKKKVTEYTLSEQTIKHHHRLISSILQTAFKKGLIKENPCNRVDAPKPKKKELTIYNEEQIYTLVEALEKADLQLKTAVHIALAGGLRLGEIMGLEWPDVDFVNSTVTICRSSQYLPHIGTFTKDPKNETSKRMVSLPRPVMALIRQLEEHQREQAEELGNKWMGRRFDNTNHDNPITERVPGRLFVNALGEPLHPHSPSKWFCRFLKDNNLPPLPFHGLRHTSASYLIACGQDVVTVSKRLGHSNSNTTLSIYAHSFRKRDEEAANKMEGLYASKEKESGAEKKTKLRIVK